MKGKTMSNATTAILVPLMLGILSAVIVYVSATGRPLPLVATPRAALIALLIVGMAACMGGIGQTAASGRWASPLAILGYLLGAAILVVILSAFTGWKLPLIGSDSQAVIAVGALMVAKFVIGFAGFAFRLL